MRKQEKRYQVLCYEFEECSVLPGPYPTHPDAVRAGEQWLEQMFETHQDDDALEGQLEYEVEEIEQ